MYKVFLFSIGNNNSLYKTQKESRFMKNKRVISMIAGIALTLADVLSADPSISDFSSAREFKGVATSLISCNVLSGFNDNWRGMITSTAYPGDIFEGPVKDAKGNILKEGTVLFTIDKTARQMLLDQNLAKLTIAKQDYERDLKLLPNHSISKKNFEKDRAAYMEAVALVKQHQYLVDLCTIHAPFDGVVDSINCVGWLSGEPAVMKVSQLVPMGILVPMDRDLANQIKPTTPIAIYPDPNISEEVFGISRGNSILTDKGIIFLVENHKSETEVMVSGKKVSVINCIYPVIPFGYAEEDKNILTVNADCMFEDEKGSFVWLAVGQKDLTPKGLDKVCSVKKVYVELLGKSICDEIFHECVAIKDTKELALNDITLAQNPSNLKDGDLITIQDQRYVFMPGDNVKVVIGPVAAN